MHHLEPVCDLGVEASANPWRGNLMTPTQPLGRQPVGVTARPGFDHAGGTGRQAALVLKSLPIQGLATNRIIVEVIAMHAKMSHMNSVFLDPSDGQ